MKLYFLVTEGVGENDVTIVSEKSLIEMLNDRYRDYADKDECVKSAFEFAVNNTKCSPQDMDLLYVMNSHVYVCKSIAQVKAIKKLEIRVQIENLKEKMYELEDMNIKRGF